MQRCNSSWGVSTHLQDGTEIHSRAKALAPVGARRWRGRLALRALGPVVKLAQAVNVNSNKGATADDKKKRLEDIRTNKTLAQTLLTGQLLHQDQRQGTPLL